MTMSVRDYQSNDTICAVATFPSKSALGVIKISGRRALAITAKIFSPKRKKDLQKVKSYTLHYGWIVEKPPPKADPPPAEKIKNQKAKCKIQDAKRKKQRFSSERIIDEVLVSVMKGPHSYTREDTVEISTHGGVFVLNKIVELLKNKGCRLAQPGEFTWRALTNGRIDLAQAQSVIDIVDAKSERALDWANRMLQGASSEKVKALKEELTRLFVQLEAVLSFPEEEIGVSFKQVRREVVKMRKELNELIVSSEKMRLLREGLACVICGKANVGKSTLFNRLLKEERVIVTEIPGTTRDIIEESIFIKGIPLRIYDTAGILEPKDLIEERALSLGKEKIEQADLILFLTDYAQKLSPRDYVLLKKIKDKNAIFIVNKADLKKKIDLRRLREFKKPLVTISALKDNDLKLLETAIHSEITKGILSKEPDAVFAHQWQIDLLSQIRQHLQQAEDFIARGYTIDFIHFSIKEALDIIEKLSGETLSEDILDQVFSTFCIGK